MMFGIQDYYNFQPLPDLYLHKIFHIFKQWLKILQGNTLKHFLELKFRMLIGMIGLVNRI